MAWATVVGSTAPVRRPGVARLASATGAAAALAVATLATAGCRDTDARGYAGPGSLVATTTSQQYRRDTASGVSDVVVRVANRGPAAALLAGCPRADSLGAYRLERRHKWSWVAATPAQPVCPTASGADTTVPAGRAVSLPVRVADAGRYRLQIRYRRDASQPGWSQVQSAPFTVR